jgi:DNA-binding MarR family transcriptional regulator
MLNMKEKIETKRKILCSLVSEPESTVNDILVRILNDKDMEYINDLLDELKEDRYINKYVPTGKREYVHVLTRKGEEFIEHISNDDRWKSTMDICAKLYEFSEQTVLNVYNQLIQRDISILVGNPLKDVSEAMFNLAGEINSYNTQNMFRR